MKKMIDEIYILRKAISLYGKEYQIWKAIEEMAELDNAIAKYSQDRVTKMDICEEIADVFIMMNQLSYIFGKEDVNNFIDSKLKRLEERLKKYENRVKN
jgi:NTP pyrophosphatase (non-canonical NTP hydrolase)